MRTPLHKAQSQSRFGSPCDSGRRWIRRREHGCASRARTARCAPGKQHRAPKPSEPHNARYCTSGFQRAFVDVQPRDHTASRRLPLTAARRYHKDERLSGTGQASRGGVQILFGLLLCCLQRTLQFLLRRHVRSAHVFHGLAQTHRIGTGHHAA